jgi:phage baseplate assembly protein V
MSIEGLRNIIHREVQRFLDRRTRRVPCIVDSYNGNTHTVKVKLQPEGVLSGWMQIQTAQVGLLVAPNIGDPGWIEFHENDRRAGVFVASNHNNNKPPPKVINAGELYYEPPAGGGSSLYYKNDGSIATVDKAGSATLMDGAGNVSASAPTKITLQAPVIVLDGTVWFAGTSYGPNGAGQITIGVPINQTAGGITTAGGVAASGDVTAGSISLSNHKHGGVQAGGSETGPPTG